MIRRRALRLHHLLRRLPTGGATARCCGRRREQPRRQAKSAPEKYQARVATASSSDCSGAQGSKKRPRPSTIDISLACTRAEREHAATKAGKKKTKKTNKDKPPSRPAPRPMSSSCKNPIVCMYTTRQGKAHHRAIFMVQMPNPVARTGVCRRKIVCFPQPTPV